jgi:large conductance mechanosensitive channel
MWKDFKAFISRGNVIDLAVGVIIGGAFTAIVNSLVNDMFMPIIGALLGGQNIEALAITIGEASINYGSFIMAVISFFLIALVLFFIIRGVTAIDRERQEQALSDEEEEEEVPALTLEEQLLIEIRDLLKGDLTTGAESGDQATEG